MPRFDSLCTVCGEVEAIVVPGGTHPPCSSCKGETIYLWTRYPASIQTNESFIGGVTLENMGHDPVTVYSRDEFKLEMAKRGLEQRIKYVPGDHYLTDWSKGVDATMLENARILVSRGK